ncbi:MAG: type VI secretion system contractile sheath large subunit [Pseudomonadota bacterium]
MSNNAAQTQETTTVQQEVSLLEQAIAATKQTERSQAENLLKVLTNEALSGTVTWNRNLTKTVDEAISKIDMLISKQVTEILHHADVQKLEGSWRGLHYLVKNTLCGPDIKIRMLNTKKELLAKDLTKAVDFDQSIIFKKIYEEEYGTPGGNPYAALIGDFAIENNATDMDFLQNMSGMAAASFCPFITAAAPSMLGLDSWEQLSKPRDLAKVFASSEYARWQGYRDTEDARFVTLVLPRTLARSPYGKQGTLVEAFAYEEMPLDEKGKAIKVPASQYCWMNTAYVMGARLTNAFAEYGWCTAIRGTENGGKVEHLPAHTFISDDGDLDMQCPTEIGITDRREAELSKQGFLPLCHYKNTNYAVFFGAQTTQCPKKYDDKDATANAEVSARLPYIMATARIAHYLKIMARDKIGSFMEISDVEKWLNDWIVNYVNSNPDSGQLLKSRYPLAEAKIEVKEVKGNPGAYQAIAWLRPWMQLEELTASLRLVASIPQKG